MEGQTKTDGDGELEPTNAYYYTPENTEIDLIDIEHSMARSERGDRKQV